MLDPQIASLANHITPSQARLIQQTGHLPIAGAEMATTGQDAHTRAQAATAALAQFTTLYPSMAGTPIEPALHNAASAFFNYLATHRGHDAGWYEGLLGRPAL